jgi:hypothetical protein
MIGGPAEGQNMSGYLKEKLYQALLSLVGSGELDARLTYAASALVVLQDRDVPPEYREKLPRIRFRLFTTPLSSEKSFMPRQISEEGAKAVAHDILGLFTAVMGGL